MTDPFESGLFGCFDDFSICFLTLNGCAPCVLTQALTQTENRENSLCDCCFITAAGFVVGPTFNFMLRKRIRALRNTPMNDCGDCLITSLFFQCSVCQVAITAKKLKQQGFFDKSTPMTTVQQFVQNSPIHHKSYNESGMTYPPLY
eukprot:TRINITY_DN1761_c0_g1_i1.p1 TRINITY_DN1761_c0_g1~~TRINITY_DN1761_c0_g1_i1.p1  ORF type:complete len:146 (-),score=30.09 TRINITY_DN1761_c0_g1_i1:101-538(-)